MNSFIFVALAAFLVSCSSHGPGSKIAAEPDAASDIKIKNQDFRKKKKLSYVQATDYYPIEKPGNALAQETAGRMSKAEALDLVKSKDPLGQMMVACYQQEFAMGMSMAEAMFDSHQNLPSYWNQVATCHLIQGHERKALLFYNKALEVSPNYAPALNNLAVIYAKNAQDQKALVALQKAQASGKFTKTPRYNSAFLLLRYGLAAEALGLLHGLLSEAPQDIELRAGEANALALLGRWPEAWSSFNRLPDSLRQRADIGPNMALAAFYNGKKELARQILSHTKDGDQNTLAEIGRFLGE